MRPNKSLILDEKTNELLKQVAKAEDRSQSAVVRQAIRYYAERQQNARGGNNGNS